MNKGADRCDQMSTLMQFSHYCFTIFSIFCCATIYTWWIKMIIILLL